nr:E4 hypothetical protein [Human papillomavirus 228]
MQNCIVKIKNGLCIIKHTLFPLPLVLALLPTLILEPPKLPSSRPPDTPRPKRHPPPTNSHHGYNNLRHRDLGLPVSRHHSPHQPPKHQRERADSADDDENKENVDPERQPQRNEEEPKTEEEVEDEEEGEVLQLLRKWANDIDQLKRKVCQDLESYKKKLGIPLS